MAACDVCPSEFSCGRLATVMQIAAARADFATNARLRAAYERLSAKLKGYGWDFPAKDRPCGLAGRTPEITRLINDMIEAMDDKRPSAANRHEAADHLIEENFND